MKKLNVDLLVLSSDSTKDVVFEILNKTWAEYYKAEGRISESVQKFNYSKTDNKPKKKVIYADEVEKALEDENKIGVLIVHDKITFQNIENELNLKYKSILIQSELGWETNSISDGFDWLEKIIRNQGDDLLQVKIFSSLDYQKLKKNIEQRFLPLCIAFPVLSISDLRSYEKVFSSYGEIHYQLIKYISLDIPGILMGQHHEILKLLRRIKEVAEEEQKIIKEKLSQCMDLILATQIESKRVKYFKEKFNQSVTVSDLENSINQFINEFDWITEINKVESSSRRHYSSASVCIIEDDKSDLQQISEILGDIFEDIYPNKEQLNTYSVEEINENIEIYANKYRLFFIDILYKNSNGWELYNGFQIAKRLLKENPNIVIRFVTDLPRKAISGLLSKIKKHFPESSIQYHHIFTKKNGIEALKFSVLERIEEIESEINYLVKRELKVKKITIPENGNLNKAKDHLLSIIKFNKERFDSYVNRAIKLYQKYVADTLKKTDWGNGSLGKNLSNDDGPRALEKWEEKYFVNHLTHRLLILHKAKTNFGYVDLLRYQKETREIFNLSVEKPRPFLHTKLGFNYEIINLKSLEDDYLHSNKKHSRRHELVKAFPDFDFKRASEEQFVKILYDNLFDHELTFLESHENAPNKNSTDLNSSREFLTLFEQLLSKCNSRKELDKKTFIEILEKDYYNFVNPNNNQEENLVSLIESML